MLHLKKTEDERYVLSDYEQEKIKTQQELLASIDFAALHIQKTAIRAMKAIAYRELPLTIKTLETYNEIISWSNALIFNPEKNRLMPCFWHEFEEIRFEIDLDKRSIISTYARSDYIKNSNFLVKYRKGAKKYLIVDYGYMQDEIDLYINFKKFIKNG